MTWERLYTTYRKQGIFLALGAGVSIDSLLPNWEELLRRLCDKLLVGRTGFGDLRQAGFSLPAIAALLQQARSREDDFPAQVREALYRDFPFFPGGVGRHNHTQFVDHVRDHNATLRAIASLCACRSGQRTFDANPKVHAIVTFNLDDLLQAYIYARYRKRLVKTIERPSATRIPDKISVYHMHGYLRTDSAWDNRQKGAPDKLVLTEQEYFDFFNAPNSLFNYTFLHMLREYSCVFVGLSMQDDNIRRLLHYSIQERKSALLQEGAGPARVAESTQRHYAILEHASSPDLDRLVASSLRSFGVRVLWVGDYQEIPERLGAMYEYGASELQWRSVY